MDWNLPSYKAQNKIKKPFFDRFIIEVNPFLENVPN